jgi:hypothetical protein
MSAVAVRDPVGTSIAERLVVNNDLSRLNPQERLQWYQAKCRIYGLDWRLAPFDYLALKTGLKLYLNALGADMLRKSQKISITEAHWEFIEALCVATVVGQTPDGRVDREIGVVSLRGVPPDGLADLPMKALTKAKRRLVISMGAMGTDEDIEMGNPPAHLIPAKELHEPEPPAPAADAEGAAPAVNETWMVHHRLTDDQQEALFNAAVERNVGAIMPVDPEQEPGTQTWGEVSNAIIEAWAELHDKQRRAGEPLSVAPHMGVLKDGRVSPGRVSRALLALPTIILPSEGDEGGA